MNPEILQIEIRSHVRSENISIDCGCTAVIIFKQQVDVAVGAIAVKIAVIVGRVSKGIRSVEF